MIAQQAVNVFQLVLFVLISLLFVTTAALTLAGRLTRREGIVLMLVFGVGLLAVAQPQWTTRIARMLGIGRGTDLILYCTAVGSVVGFLAMYLRIRQLRREITILVRELALRDTRHPPTGDPAHKPAPIPRDADTPADQSRT